MKYIRTKDNIYELKEPYYIDIINHLCWKVSFLPLVIHDMGEIIKQADTIEELCDGFIITSKQGHIYDSYGDFNYELKEVLPQAREEHPYEDWDLYGCILIDGIIKQVAKFNDKKGDWELL